MKRKRKARFFRKVKNYFNHSCNKTTDESLKKNKEKKQKSKELKILKNFFKARAELNKPALTKKLKLNIKRKRAEVNWCLANL